MIADFLYLSSEEDGNVQFVQKLPSVVVQFVTSAIFVNLFTDVLFFQIIVMEMNSKTAQGFHFLHGDFNEAVLVESEITEFFDNLFFRPVDKDELGIREFFQSVFDQQDVHAVGVSDCLETCGFHLAAQCLEAVASDKTLMEAKRITEGQQVT